jgi:chemotaxis protein histidine kinase CheA
METNPEPIKEILDELFSLLEALETQSLALTQFLKDQGIATEEKLAPYLDRAGNASSVKWRAARARMQYLLSPVAKETDDQAKDKNKESEKPPAEKQSTEKQSTEKQPTEKPSTEQNKPGSPDITKDTAQNKNANAGKDQKPATPKPAADDAAKKSDTRQKSKRE